jgi:hypothetical protein
VSKLSQLLRKWFIKPKPKATSKNKAKPKVKAVVESKVDHEDPFYHLVTAFGERCERWPIHATGEGKRFGVLITPWLSTAVPLLLLECVRYLSAAGRHCVLIVDGTNLTQNAEEPKHLQWLDELIQLGFSDFEVVRVSNSTNKKEETKEAFSDEDLAAASRLLRENAIWRARGENDAELVASNRFSNAKAVAAHLGLVSDVLMAARLDQLVLPGGIFGLSGLYLHSARKAGVPFATFDGTNQILRLCQNGVAAHLEDIPAAFLLLREVVSPVELEQAAAGAFSELDDRVNARDFRQFQLVSAQGNVSCHYDIVVPLNIRWDSAALGRQRAFASVEAWLRALLSWVAARPKVTICLRQHPRERLAFAKSRDDLAPLLAEFSGLGDRLRYVQADEEISSYDLLRQAIVVLPHTSTVGIEAAMLGKAVVLSTTCYYENLGFCLSARDSQEYFDLLAAALEDKAQPTYEARQWAAFAYHLTQNCAYVRTCFTAVPDDFRLWNAMSPEELWARPEMSDFAEALTTGQPLAVVRHRRLIQEASSDKLDLP